MAQKREIGIGFVKTKQGRFQLLMGAGTKVVQVGGSMLTLGQVRQDASDLLDFFQGNGIDAGLTDEAFAALTA